MKTEPHKSPLVRYFGLTLMVLPPGIANKAATAGRMARLTATDLAQIGLAVSLAGFMLIRLFPIGAR